MRFRKKFSESRSPGGGGELSFSSSPLEACWVDRQHLWRATLDDWQFLLTLWLEDQEVVEARFFQHFPQLNKAQLQQVANDNRLSMMLLGNPRDRKSLRSFWFDSLALIISLSRKLLRELSVISAGTKTASWYSTRDRRKAAEERNFSLMYSSYYRPR